MKKRYTFKLSAHTKSGRKAQLNAMRRGKIIIALDEANLRPVKFLFYSEIDDDHSYLDLTYQFEGHDKLNLQANAHKFYENNIAPCIDDIIDNISFKLWQCT